MRLILNGTSKLRSILWFCHCFGKISWVVHRFVLQFQFFFSLFVEYVLTISKELDLFFCVHTAAGAARKGRLICDQLGSALVYVYV